MVFALNLYSSVSVGGSGLRGILVELFTVSLFGISLIRKNSGDSSFEPRVSNIFFYESKNIFHSSLIVHASL